MDKQLFFIYIPVIGLTSYLVDSSGYKFLLDNKFSNYLINLIIAPGAMLPPGVSGNYLCLAILITLVPSFYLSYIIEGFFYQIFPDDPKLIDRGVKKANLISHLLVGIYVITLWYSKEFNNYIPY